MERHYEYDVALGRVPVSPVTKVFGSLPAFTSSSPALLFSALATVTGGAVTATQTEMDGATVFCMAPKASPCQPDMFSDNDGLGGNVTHLRRSAGGSACGGQAVGGWGSTGAMSDSGEAEAGEQHRGLKRESSLCATRGSMMDLWQAGRQQRKQRRRGWGVEGTCLHYRANDDAAALLAAEMPLLLERVTGEDARAGRWEREEEENFRLPGGASTPLSDEDVSSDSGLHSKEQQPEDASPAPGIDLSPVLPRVFLQCSKADCVLLPGSTLALANAMGRLGVPAVAVVHEKVLHRKFIECSATPPQGRGSRASLQSLLSWMDREDPLHLQLMLDVVKNGSLSIDGRAGRDAATAHKKPMMMILTAGALLCMPILTAYFSQYVYK